MHKSHRFDIKKSKNFHTPPLHLDSRIDLGALPLNPPLKISGYATERPNPDAAIADNDENLFRKMLYNVQKQFLPGVTNHQYHVRQRRHNDCLTGKTDDKRLCIFGLKNAYTNPFQCEWPF